VDISFRDRSVAGSHGRMALRGGRVLAVDIVGRPC